MDNRTIEQIRDNETSLIKELETKDEAILKLNNKLKKIYEIVHYNCYYPELENYSNDLDDDDIKEIIELLKGFEN